MSPRSRRSLNMFSHLARGLRISLRSAAALLLFLEHSPRFQSVLLIVILFASRPSCVMKDVCFAATSRCAPIKASPHTPHTSLTNSPSLRPGLRLCSLCPGCHLLQLSCGKCRATEEDEYTTKKQSSNVAAPLPWLNVPEERDAKEFVFWHCYDLMKCQDETVSTMVCMCQYITLYVYKNSSTKNGGAGTKVLLRSETRHLIFFQKKEALAQRRFAWRFRRWTCCPPSRKTDLHHLHDLFPALRNGIFNGQL